MIMNKAPNMRCIYCGVDGKDYDNLNAFGLVLRCVCEEHSFAFTKWSGLELLATVPVHLTVQ